MHSDISQPVEGDFNGFTFVGLPPEVNPYHRHAFAEKATATAASQPTKEQQQSPIIREPFKRQCHLCKSSMTSVASQASRRVGKTSF